MTGRNSTHTRNYHNVQLWAEKLHLDQEQGTYLYEGIAALVTLATMNWRAAEQPAKLSPY